MRLGFNALLCRSKSDKEQDETHDSPDRHGHLPAVLSVVPGCEFGNQRQGEATHNELRCIHGYKPVGVELGALVDVAGHDSTQCRVWHIVH